MRIIVERTPGVPIYPWPSVGNGLPLEIGNRIGTAAGEGHDVIFPIARTATARPAGRWARMLALELARDRA